MELKGKEGGRVLRSKGNEALAKAHIQDTQLRRESLGQKMSTPKKQSERKKHSESSGKENEPSSVMKGFQDQKVKRRDTQGTWK